MLISRRGYNWNNRYGHQTGGPITRWAYWGPFHEGPEKFSGPESHNNNPQPYLHRAVHFTQF